ILLDLFFFFLLLPRTPRSTLFPYTTLFRSLSESQSPGGKDVDSLVRGRWFAKPGREGLLIAVGLVKLRGEGGAEEHNGAGGVNPGQERNYRAHPAVNPLIVEQRNELYEDIAGDFPQNGGCDGPRQRLDPKHLAVGHQLVNHQEYQNGNQESGADQKPGPEPVNDLVLRELRNPPVSCRSKSAHGTGYARGGQEQNPAQRQQCETSEAALPEGTPFGNSPGSVQGVLYKHKDPG